MAEMLAITLAAIAFTLPISAMNFGTISVVAPLANLFVVPAFVAVALTAGITAITVLAVPETADVVVWVAWIPVAYMLAAIRVFASLPLVAVNVDNFTIAYAVVSYTAIASFTWWLSRRSTEVPTRVPPTLRLRKVAAAGGLTATIAVAVALAWMTLSHGDEPRVSVTVLDIGQGDAILIEDRAGRRVLVDGGPRGDDLALALGRHLPFYNRRIDVVIVTHPQADHLTGLLEVIDSYDVSSVIAGPIDDETDLTMEWEAAVAAAGINVSPPRNEQVIAMDGAQLRVTYASRHASNLNDQSVVLRLVAGESSFLLTGDLGEEGERELLSTGAVIASDVLKVGHHGSRFSSSSEFLARVDPAVNLISVGSNNPYGHPAPDLLKRIEETLVFRTDEDGDITISTDGDRLWVQTQR